MLNSIELFLARLFTGRKTSQTTHGAVNHASSANSTSRKLPTLALVCGFMLIAAGCDSGGGSSSGNGGQISLDDDSSVSALFEERRFEILPGVGETSDVNVESWRWSDSPTRFGPLVECSGLEGFENSLAVRNLSEACGISDRCNFSFDQSDVQNPDGTRSASFIVEVPTLRAPIGLAYQLRGLTDVGDTITSSATFCLIPINEAPFAENDSFTVVQGDVLQINGTSALNLLSNDTDDDDRSNMALTVASTPIVAPQFATQFSLATDGGFTYQFDGDLSIQGGTSVVDTFQYQISDGIHVSTAEVRITVVSRNDPPTINDAIPSHIAVIGIPTEFDFSASFTDPEGSQLEYSIVAGSLPEDSDFEASVLGVLTGTAPPDSAGNFTVTAVASDGVSTASGNFLLTIVENQLPVTSALSDQSIEFGTLVNLDVSNGFQDPEGVPLIFSLVSEPASDLIINPQSGLISGNLLEAGTFTITVSASDGFNEEVSTTFAITQGTRPNRTPLFSGSIANQGILIGQTITPVSGNFSDLDEDDLTFSISSLPEGMAFDQSTGVLTGTPEQLGIFNLTITATDEAGAAVSSNVFTITVSEVPNEVPTFDSPIQDMTVTQGVAITAFTAQFTDPEGRSLSFTSSALPAGLVLNEQTGEVTGTPTSPGIFNVTITAQDDAGDTITSNTFTLTVNPPPNTSPVFSGSIADVSVTIGTAISPISGDFTDSDSLTYSTTALPAGINLNPNTGVLTGTPSNEGTTNVILTATDTDGNSVSSNEFVITVTAIPNNAPTFPDAIPAQSAVVGSSITPLTLSGFFSDIDSGDSLVFIVNSANPLPTGLTLSPAGIVTGTPTSTGSFSVVITATDDAGAAVSSTPFTYTITSANVAPVISGRTPTGTINLVSGDTETIEFSVTDESLSTVEFEATSSSSAVSITTVSDGEYSVTADSQGTSTITFTVTDAQGLSDTETVTVTVTAVVDDPPQISSVTPAATSVTVIPGTPLSVSLAASDESVSTLTYSANSSAPTVATVATGSAGSYTITANPTSSTSPGGTTIITLTVTDAAGQSDTHTLNVTVPAPPAADLAPVIVSRTPAADPITDVFVGDVEDITLVVNDEDSSTLVYSFSAAPIGIVTVNSQGDGTYQVAGVAAGTTTLTLMVTDAAGQSDTEVFDIQVPEENLAPEFTGSISNQTYLEGVAIAELDISGFFSDPNGDALSFTESGLPAGLSMNSAGVISGTPTATGTASVTITATDEAGSGTSTDSNTFTITITAVANLAPVFTGSIADETYLEGVAITTLDISGFFSDPESDALSFTNSGLPIGLSMNSDGEISGTPTATGTTSVTITATDDSDAGNNTASNEFVITIAAAANQAPIFTSDIADVTYTEDLPIDPLDINGFVSDPESDELTFSSSTLPMGLSISSAGVISGTPTATGTAFDTTVTITATDESGSGISAVSNDFIISVTS